jgi:hypothetical protein
MEPIDLATMEICTRKPGRRVRRGLEARPRSARDGTAGRLTTIAIGRWPSLLITAAALACVLVALGWQPQLAHAGTWYVNPTMTNATGSTAQQPCVAAGHPSWTGCMLLDVSGVDDGNFTANQYGATGGRHTLPAFAQNVDEPAFDAPHFDEGADGYYEYTMPDGNHYSMVAEDDENGLGEFPNAYPGCGANPGESDLYVCLATFPSGVQGYPSSSQFDPSFTFYPQGGAAPYTAAGQVCSEGSGTFECTVGRTCSAGTSGLGHVTLQCSAATAGGGEWSPTDPNNYMFLTFYDQGSDGPVTVTDLGAPDLGGIRASYPASCSMQTTGDMCSIYTSGGCALGFVGLPVCGSDAIQISDGDASHASVEILNEAEIPTDMAQHWRQTYINGLIGTIIQGFTTGGGTGYGSSETVGGRPVLRRMRVSAVSRRQRRGLLTVVDATRRDRRLTVSYRDSRPATTVLTLARGLPGMRRGGRCVPRVGAIDARTAACTRWVTLPGRRLRFSSEVLWAPGTSGRACPPGAVVRSQAHCQLVMRLFGHLRHRDQAGRNTTVVSLGGGRRLVTGRYRLTAVAALASATSRPLSTTFAVHG